MNKGTTNKVFKRRMAIMTYFQLNPVYRKTGIITRSNESLLEELNEYDIVDYTTTKALKSDLKALEDSGFIKRRYTKSSPNKTDRKILINPNNPRGYSLQELQYLINPANHKIKKFDENCYSWLSKKDGLKWTIHSLKDYTTENKAMHHMMFWMAKYKEMIIQKELKLAEGLIEATSDDYIKMELLELEERYGVYD